MFIDEAVITASRYHDFLRVTLPYTLHHVTLDSEKIPTSEGIKSYYDLEFVASSNPNKSYRP